MAKMLKQLVFGQKKNPPAPPRPDYEGDNKSASVPYSHPADMPFFDHNYENLPKFKCKGAGVQFAEKKQPELVVFDNYSEPADLRLEMSTLESDPLYMSPLDDQGTAPPLPPEGEEEDIEEDMYCVPYDTPEEEGAAPPLPQPCLAPGGRAPEEGKKEERLASDDATYDVVPDESECSQDDSVPLRTAAENVEYDEPWEWSVGARLTNSLQVSPSPSLEEQCDHSSGHAPDRHEAGAGPSEEEEMAAVSQQCRLVYETAFDSLVPGDTEEQPPGLLLLRGNNGCCEHRAASRSSFGSSTSGSSASASSTPTHHQSTEVAARQHHFTPVTERWKVSLLGPGSPQARSGGSGPRVVVPNQNFERKISFIGNSPSSHHPQSWDSPVSRCSSSDKSSSQESMSIELPPARNSSPSSQDVLGRSASRDSLNRFLLEQHLVSSPRRPSNSAKAERDAVNPYRDSPGKGTTEDGMRKEEASAFIAKKSMAGVKVLPTDSPRFLRARSSKSSCDLALQQLDPELKENNHDSKPPNYRHPSTRHHHHHPHHGSRPHQRRSSLLSEVRPMDNLPQSPDNDDRSSSDYDPPWDLKTGGLPTGCDRGGRPPGVFNGSASVPERLSSCSSGGQSRLPTSATHDRLLETDEAKASAADRSNGGTSRPSLNLDLGSSSSSDSPRRGRQNLSLDFGCGALTAVGEKVDPQLTLEKQGWYHGSISRVEAESKLRVLKEGSYLVRNSESSKHDYSLSLKSARGFMHMKIAPTSSGRFVLGQFSNPFASIPEMVSHYSAHKLPIKGAEHMSLLYPVIDQLL